MDYIALLSVNCFLRRKKGSLRFFFTALLASIGSFCAVIFIKDTGIREIFIHLVLNTALVFIGFGRCSKKEFIENWAVMYFAVFLAGGVMEWLSKGTETVSDFMWYALVAAVLLTIANIYLNKRKNLTGNLFPVELHHKGTVINLMAYWDSGNQLYDIYTKKPVCIMDEELGEALLGIKLKAFEALPGVRYIPFCSLGETEGLLAVYDVEKMQIFTGRKKLEITKAVIGLADKRLFENKEYKMILHSSMQL